LKPFSPILSVRKHFTTLFAIAGLCLGASAWPAGAGVIASGTFQSKEAGIAAKGDFEIEEIGGKFKLVIKSGFQVSEGPDLFFAFNPLPASQVTGSNAKTDALRIDPALKSLSGAQTYDLPDDFNVDGYATLIVHCWKYNHLYAAAAVKKSAGTALRPGTAGHKGATPESTGPSLRGENGKVGISAADGRRYDLSGRNLSAGAGKGSVR
jgi:hypothetical protein